jgi:hypothetical protein
MRSIIAAVIAQLTDRLRDGLAYFAICIRGRRAQGVDRAIAAPMTHGRSNSGSHRGHRSDSHSARMWVMGAWRDMTLLIELHQIQRGERSARNCTSRPPTGNGPRSMPKNPRCHLCLGRGIAAREEQHPSPSRVGSPLNNGGARSSDVAKERRREQLVDGLRLKP